MFALSPWVLPVVFSPVALWHCISYSPWVLVHKKTQIVLANNNQVQKEEDGGEFRHCVFNFVWVYPYFQSVPLRWENLHHSSWSTTHNVLVHSGRAVLKSGDVANVPALQMDGHAKNSVFLARAEHGGISRAVEIFWRIVVLASKKDKLFDSQVRMTATKNACVCQFFYKNIFGQTGMLDRTIFIEGWTKFW